MAADRAARVASDLPPAARAIRTRYEPQGRTTWVLRSDRRADSPPSAKA